MESCLPVGRNRIILPVPLEGYSGGCVQKHRGDFMYEATATFQVDHMEGRLEGRKDRQESGRSQGQMLAAREYRIPYTE
jgi:hypothetical protein